MAEVTSDRIIAAYLTLRDRKEAFNRAAKEIAEGYEKKMDRLAAELLKRINDSKQRNISTDAGMAIKQLEIIPTCGDWDSFYTWIAETNSFEALERRVKKTFIQEYMEENEGAVPPGVSVMRSFKAVVRKPTARKGIPDAEE